MKLIKLIFLLLILNSYSLAQSSEKISLRLQWKHQFEFAGFYMAKEKGYYKQAGIDVDIYEYNTNIDIVEEVVTGKKDLAIWGSGVIEQAMNGKPLVLLANYFKRSPLAIITKPEILLPSELKNKKLMIPKSDFESANYNQMFKIFNIKNEDLELIPSSFNIQDFIDGKVDAYSSFLTNEPYILRKKGVRYNVLDPNNYGIEMYDVNLFSSKEFTEKNPILIKKFIEASNKGWNYALQNKEESVNLILEKYNTQNKSKEHLLFEAKETERMMLPKIYPIGSIDIKKIQKMGNLFTEIGMTNHFTNYQSIIFQEIETSANLTKQEINFIEKNRVIPISVMKDFSPFSFERDGVYRGFVNDTLSLLEEKTGLKFQRVTGQWVENLERFKTKQTHVIADISHKKEREEFTLFSQPYYEIPTLIFVRDDFKNYNGLESFKGKKVGVQKDIFYAKEVGEIEGVELVVNESIEEMAKELSYGKIDIAIMNLLTMNHYIKKNGLINILAIDELMLPNVNKEDLRFGINPDKPLLFSIMQKGLQAITIEEWTKITNSWIGLNAKKDNFENENSSTHPRKEQRNLLSNDEIKYLENKKELKICIAPNWMPLESLDNNGKHTGIGSELRNIIQNKIAKEFTLVPTKSWQESLENMKNKKCDILSLVKNTQSRQQYLNFTSTVLNIPYVVATKKDKFFIDNFDEIKHNKFAVIKGYSIEEDLRLNYPESTIVSVKNIDEGLKLVQEGKVYGYIDATASIGYAIDKNELYDLKIIGKLPLEYKLSYGIVKDDLTLLEILKKAVDDISDSEKNRIYRKWIAVEHEKIVDYSLIYKILGVSLIFILFITYWNRKLLIAKKEIENTNKLLRLAQKEIEKKNEELKKLAITDKLTGIYNRARLDELLQEEINRSERFKHKFAFCIMDIDYFKSVNDTYGHQIGDEVLIEISKLLKNYTRKTDYVGRWGGEEFVIIIPEIDEINAQNLIEKMRVNIENYSFKIVGKRTASFGLTIYKDNDNAEDILKRADDALYKAKKNGRNRVILN